MSQGLNQYPVVTNMHSVSEDYDHRQVNWFMPSWLQTTDWNDHSTKSMAYHNSEQVYEPRLEPVSNGY